MIVWLNGPFGVGKSAVADELTRRRSGAGQYDPERVGWLLKRTVGVLRPGDYQNLRLWRRATVSGAARQAHSDDPLVVAMSVLRLEYLTELTDGLTRKGLLARHILLDVSAPVLAERIDADKRDEGARAWRLANVDKYFEVREQLREFDAVVDTDGLSPAKVADAVEAIVDGTE